MRYTRSPSKHLLLPWALLVALIAGIGIAGPSQAQSSRTIPLHDVQRRPVGAARLTDTSGGLTVELSISRMNPVAGDRTVILYERGVCRAAAYAASVGNAVVLKEPTLHRYCYNSHQQLREHLATLLMTYNFAMRLKPLGDLTPFRSIRHATTP